jgi:hypothetical protein
MQKMETPKTEEWQSQRISMRMRIQICSKKVTAFIVRTQVRKSSHPFLFFGILFLSIQKIN